MAYRESSTLSRSNPDVKRLLAITFPEYRGRKIRLTITDRPMRLANYWDGGTRSYYKAVDLNTGRVADPSSATGNPFNGLAHVEFSIPPAVAVVEHIIFQGKDCGLEIHVRPESQTMLTGFHPGRLALNGEAN